MTYHMTSGVEFPTLWPHADGILLGFRCYTSEKLDLFKTVTSSLWILLNLHLFKSALGVIRVDEDSTSSSVEAALILLMKEEEKAEKEKK